MGYSQKMVGDAGRKGILLIGAPRSGTTWVAEILGLLPDVEYIHEPDNEKSSVLGRYGKSFLPRFPLLTPNESQPAYRSLWHIAFTAPGAALLSSVWLARLWLYDRAEREQFVLRKEQRFADGYWLDPMPAVAVPPPPAFLKRLADLKMLGTDTANVRLVKSVHGVLAVEWIARTTSVHHVIVVMRNPYGILASWRRLKMPDAARAACLTPRVLRAAFGERAEQIREALKTDLQSPITQSALQLAVMHRVLLDAAARNPHWIIIHHEDLCKDPALEFKGLFERLGLPWSELVRHGIAVRNREGKGYRTVRVAGKEPGKWRKDFTFAEMEHIGHVFLTCGFDLTTAASGFTTD